MKNKIFNTSLLKLSTFLIFFFSFAFIAIPKTSNAQSLGYSGGLCVNNAIEIYLTGGGGCGTPTVSSSSSWSVSPAPSSITYLNSNLRIRVSWNTPVSASVYVNYGCASGGSGGSTSPLNLTISAPVTPSVALSTNNPSICQGSGSIILTASPTNGGASPYYYYYVDGVSVYNGTASSYTYSTSGLLARRSEPCSSKA